MRADSHLTPEPTSTGLLVRYARVAALRGASLAVAATFLFGVTVVLPPSEFGRLNLLLSVIQIVGVATLSWPNQALLRFAREEFVNDGHIGNSLASRLTLYLTMLAIVLPLIVVFAEPVATWLHTEPTTTALLLTAGVVVVSISDLAAFTALATNKLTGYGTAPLLLRTTQLIFLAIAFFASAPAWSVLMLGTLTGYLAGSIATIRRIPTAAIKTLRPKMALVRRMLSYSWIFPFAGVSAALLNWMDLWFIRHFHGIGEAGIYAWAYSITFLATALLVPLSAVLAPVSIDLELAGKKAQRDQLLRSLGALTVVVAILAPLALVTLRLGFSIIDFGPYKASLAPLLVLAAGVLLQLGMAQLEPVALVRPELAPRLGAILIAAAFSNAIGDAILVPGLGPLGAALATVGAYAVGLLGLARLIRRISSVHFPSIPFVLVTAGLSALAILITDAGPVVTLAAGLATTIGLFLVFRANGLLAALSTLGSGNNRSRPARGFTRICDWLAGGVSKPK